MCDDWRMIIPSKGQTELWTRFWFIVWLIISLLDLEEVKSRFVQQCFTLWKIDDSKKLNVEKADNSLIL